MGKKDIKLMLEACDVQHDGFIDYEKFVYMVDGKAEHLKMAQQTE